MSTPEYKNRSDLVEERTKEFFSQDLNDLSRRLVGMIIQDDETKKIILVTRTQPWRFKVGKRFSARREMQSGNLWVCPVPGKTTSELLVVARQYRGYDFAGGSVRIIRAQRFDPRNNSFIQMHQESDIINFLGLKDDEKGKLSFIDRSNTLHLFRT